MKAMILAAGFGTRLHPLTQTIPKALVPLAGRPLLEITLQRLVSAGCSRIAINVHHFADQVQAWLDNHHYPDVEIQVSIEEEILGTGGGIKRMVHLLGDDAPILVYNVDVLSALPLQDLYHAHQQQKALATLAVQSRKTRRYLLFDAEARLCGRVGSETQEPEFVCKPAGGIHFLAFNGVQVIEPRLFLNHDEERFSSVDLYLGAAKGKGKVLGWRMDDWYWRDLGRPFDLEEAEKDIRERRLILE